MADKNCRAEKTRSKATIQGIVSEVAAHNSLQNHKRIDAKYGTMTIKRSSDLLSVLCRVNASRLISGNINMIKDQEAFAAKPALVSGGINRLCWFNF